MHDFVVLAFNWSLPISSIMVSILSYKEDFSGFSLTEVFSIPSHKLSCAIILYIDSVVKSFCLELGYLKVQYWATSASCFGVLIFIFLLMRRSPNNSCSFSSNSPQGLKFSSSCVVSCAVLCCVSFAIISYYGEFSILHLLYHFCPAWVETWDMMRCSF